MNPQQEALLRAALDQFDPPCVPRAPLKARDLLQEAGRRRRRRQIARGGWAAGVMAALAAWHFSFPSADPNAATLALLESSGRGSGVVSAPEADRSPEAGAASAGRPRPSLLAGILEATDHQWQQSQWRWEQELAAAAAVRLETARTLERIGRLDEACASYRRLAECAADTPSGAIAAERLLALNL